MGVGGGVIMEEHRLWLEKILLQPYSNLGPLDQQTSASPTELPGFLTRRGVISQGEGSEKGAIEKNKQT